MTRCRRYSRSRLKIADELPLSGLQLTPKADSFREMISFDRLPVEVRVALNFSAFRHDAGECYEIIGRGIDASRLVGVIIHKDASMMRESGRT